MKSMGEQIMLMLKEMEYVYAVYQERSFSKAAKKLYLSQPALSAAVRKAEEEIHTAIFDRSTNPICLTAAGEYYIDAVKRILDIREEMQTYFEALAGECQGTVQVGAASFFCAHVLPGIIESFQEQYPSWHVSLLEANAGDLRKCIQSGILDFSLDVEPTDSRLFESRVWYHETILLAVPRDFSVNQSLKDYCLTVEDIRNGVHHQEQFQAVDLSLFSEVPFVILKKGNDLYNRAMTMCRNAGFKPRIAMQLDQLLTSYYVARDGKGAAFLRDGLAQFMQQDVPLCFYKINDKNAKRAVLLSWKKSSELSKPARAFLHYVTQEHN